MLFAAQSDLHAADLQGSNSTALTVFRTTGDLPALFKASVLRGNAEAGPFRFNSEELG